MADPERKSETFTLKLSPAERQLVRWGAQLVSETPSGFVREAGKGANN